MIYEEIKEPDHFKMPCCTKIMWVVCKPQMPPWVMVQQVGVSVGVWVTGTLKPSDLGRKEEKQ